MKKFLALLAVIVFSFVGCEIPQTIKIKTKAEYEFTVLKPKPIDFGEYFNSKDLMANFSNGDMKVYDYNPGGNNEIQKFLVEVPVQKFKIASGFDDLASMDAMNFDKKLEIPQGNSDINSPVPMDAFKVALNSIVQFNGTEKKSKVQFGTDSDSFSSIKYKSGTLQIVVVGEPTSVELKKGKTVLSSDDFKYTSSSLVDANGYFELNLADETIYNDMTIEFSGNVTKYLGKIKDITEAEIIRAEGVTTDKIKVTNEITLNILSGEEQFKKCVIGEGELDISFKTPESWTGITPTWDNVSIKGGINVENDEFEKTNGKCTAPLNGKSLKTDPAKLNPTVSIRANNASFDFEKPPAIKGKCDIKKFSEVIAALPKGTDTTFSKNEPLSNAMGDSVIEIYLNQPKLVVNYYNTLPNGNDYKFNCSSKLLNISGTDTMKSGNPESDTNTSMGPFTSETKVGEKTRTDIFDFTAGFDFGLTPAEKKEYETDGTKCMKVKDVMPGETYKIGVDMKLDLDWTYVKINMENFKTGGGESEIIDTGIELSSMFDGFKDAFGEGGDLFDNISIIELPLYVYCSSPLSDWTLTGNIILGTSENRFTPYKDDKGNDETLFGNDIPWASKPSLEYSGDGNDTVINDIAKFTPTAEKKLSKFMKSGSGTQKATLCMKRDNLGISKNGSSEGVLTIEKDELGDLKNADIEILAYLVLSLDFNVGDPDDKNIDVTEKTYTLNVGKIINGTSENSGKEALAREAKETDPFGAIDEIKIGIEPVKLPFICKSDSNQAKIKSLGIAIKGINENQPTELAKGHYISTKNSSISIENIINSPTDYLDITLHFPVGTFALRRDPKFEALLNFGLSTDGEIPLDALIGGN